MPPTLSGTTGDERIDHGLTEVSYWRGAPDDALAGRIAALADAEA